jgi:hypothetical protein
MVGKHYGWHKRWTLDAAGGAAIHESGFAVQFVPENGYSNMTPGGDSGKCCYGAQTWIVNCILSAKGLEEWRARQVAQGVRGADAISKRWARLMREAGNLWVNHKKREKKHDGGNSLA